MTKYDDIQLTNITSYFYGYDGNTEGKKPLRSFYESATKLAVLLECSRKGFKFEELDGIN